MAMLKRHPHGIETNAAAISGAAALGATPVEAKEEDMEDHAPHKLCSGAGQLI